MFLPVERKFKDIAKVLHTLKEKIFMDSVVRQIPVGKFHEFWDRGGSYYMYYFNYPMINSHRLIGKYEPHLQTICNKTPANENFLFCSIQPLGSQHFTALPKTRGNAQTSELAYWYQLIFNTAKQCEG